MAAKTVPGLTQGDADKVMECLQGRLACFNDLHLTLKHIHWNVAGPNFIAVHEMLDPQVDFVRGLADIVAERIATMGGVPDGTSGAIIKHRTWGDYTVGRASVRDHLEALDAVYTGVITSNREGIGLCGELDPVSEGILVDATAELEKYQWFVRAHLTD